MDKEQHKLSKENDGNFLVIHVPTTVDYVVRPEGIIKEPTPEQMGTARTITKTNVISLYTKEGLQVGRGSPGQMYDMLKQEAEDTDLERLKRMRDGLLPGKKAYRSLPIQELQALFVDFENHVFSEYDEQPSNNC
ncbi:hypothetical protein BDB00DRAFT_874852 [Zychaea mexicana]|uniref:uncharacterized protein n=1 Tax=Zychaea mexicana TaxID=64656 RepID=UPI0022FEBD96|nr:uncharacterized protein BDB00DRAFT_874852 [Zychaea mexicana]KAI9490850.1 hypothetical protein BDB00DRAFT_874852 [Zychaea mexicana]